jgi:hypothetical protein
MVSAPNDGPFLPRDLVARLHRTRADADAPLACARSRVRQLLGIALWPVELADELRYALVAEGVRKVDDATRSGLRPGQPSRSIRSSTSTRPQMQPRRNVWRRSIRTFETGRPLCR